MKFISTKNNLKNFVFMMEKGKSSNTNFSNRAKNSVIESAFQPYFES